MDSLAVVALYYFNNNNILILIKERQLYARLSTLQNNHYKDNYNDNHR